MRKLQRRAKAVLALVLVVSLTIGSSQVVYATSAQKQEIEECHRTLSEALGKPERRLVLRIIDAKDRIAEDTSIDSFITGFELAWKLSMELNYYENERSVSCRTAMELRARFTSKEEEK